MAGMPDIANFARALTSSGALNNTTNPITVTIASGVLPAYVNGCTVVLHNGTTYPNAADDPNVEVAEITGIAGSDVTLSRPNAVAHAGVCTIGRYLTAEDIIAIWAAMLSNPMTTQYDHIIAGVSGVPARQTQAQWEAAVRALVGSYDIDIVPFHPIASSGTWTNFFYSSNATWKGEFVQSSGANTDYADFADVFLPAGTWKMILVVGQEAASGILTVRIDGSNTAATVDTYNGVFTTPVVVETGTFTVASPGIKRVGIATPTKNGSASTYQATVYKMHLRRTGA